jgi:hypothetical protein
MAPLRPHEASTQALAITRLVAAKAQADGFGPDDWQVMEGLQQWAIRLPHEQRIACLRELGGRTDDLWLVRRLVAS